MRKEDFLDDTLLKVEEVGKMFGVSRHTVRKWAQQGLIKRYRINSRVIRYSKKSIDEMVQRQIEAKEMENRLNDIAHAIDERLPEGTGFFCLITAFGAQSRARYISNMERESAINTMKEWLIVCSGEEEWMKQL